MLVGVGSAQVFRFFPDRLLEAPRRYPRLSLLPRLRLISLATALGAPLGLYVYLPQS